MAQMDATNGSAGGVSGRTGAERRDLRFPLGVAVILLFILFYAATAYKAPAIEADILARSSQEAADALKLRSVEIEVDGRRPTATGVVATDAERDRLIGRLTHDVWGALEPVDNLVTVPQIDPYRLAATLSRDGSLRVSGPAPSVDALDAIVAAAQSVSNNADVELPLGLGAPSADWSAVVVAGLEALGSLEAGTLVVEGRSAVLEGVAEGAEPTTAIETARAAIEARAFTWTSEVRAAVPEIAPYRFAAEKSAEGAWRIDGYAADADQAERVTAAIRAAIGDEAEISLAPGVGAPSETWWTAVDNGLRALAIADEGAIEILDGAGTATATLSSADAAAEFDALTEEAGGVVWSRKTSLAPQEAEPAALTLSIDAVDGVSMAGRLPEDLAAPETLSLLGVADASASVADAPVALGGEGDAATWRNALEALGDVAAEFDTLTVTIEDGGIVVDGAVHAASDVDQVRDRLLRGLGGSASVDLTTAAGREDGAQRDDPFSGASEVYRNGFWLPVIDRAAAGDCQAGIDALALHDQVRFLTDSDALDVRARRALNALASLADVCFEASAYRLEIGGHTDSVGEAGYNLSLSERRAAAVLEALSARGLDPERLIAKGYGETRPVAANDDEAGRAKNRRITFDLQPLE